MPRRAASLRRAVLLAVAAAAAAVAAPACDRSGPPPNVLLIVMDTTRADRCSFLGYDRPTTPHLEELARDSLVFTDAWSPASWTFPAHAGLFTGRTPDSLGLTRAWPAHLGDDTPVLAEILSRDGWETGCFTNNAWIAPYSGLARGFSVVEPVYSAPGGGSAVEAHDRALSWMTARKREGRPFFAFINDVEPHAPWTPPRDLAAGFVSPSAPVAAVDAAQILCVPQTLNVYVRGLEFQPTVREAASDLYDAEVRQLDGAIGSLLAGMREEGLLDSTLVVVTSDHGEGLGDHGWMEHGILLHRELLRVPLLVRPPGGCEPHAITDVVRLHDLFATILDACGVAAPAGIDSRSLLGPTAGRQAIAAERTRLDACNAVADNVSPEAAASLRVVRRSLYDGRHHLIVGDDGSVELYEPALDPREQRNLAAARPGVVAALRAALDAAR